MAQEEGKRKHLAAYQKCGYEETLGLLLIGN